MDYQKVEGEVKEKLFQLATLYPTYNLKMIDALNEFRKVKQQCSEEKDENGKTLSAAKADVLADATPEAHAYEVARAHVQNIEMMVEALSFHADQ